ncbi:MAG: hypothetical protein ACXV8A_06390, partial [Chthoniobacterales bacterium]
MVPTAPASPSIRAAFLRDRPARTHPAVPASAVNDHSLGGTFFAFVVQASPALFLVWFILRYGIDTPWGDQWDGMAQLFEKMQAGTLGLGDFFAFHNEHRIFFPRLVSFALARLTHWNIRAEMVVIWALLCLCAVNLRGLALATGWRESRGRGWLVLATNILLFTVLQWENLLWGFQIGFIFPLATLTASLWAAVALRRPFDFLVTMALCLATTFSIASGFTSWFLTAPLLLVSLGKERSSRENLWWALWLGIALLSTYFYFHGFTRPRNHPSETHALAHPLFALQFFLAYLGNPFASGTWLKAAYLAPVTGAVLLLTLAVCVTCLWRQRADKTLLARALPWIALTGIALTNALLTTIGRAGFGISAALPSRYVSFALMLPIGLLFLVSLLVRHLQTRVIVLVLGATFAVLFFSASVHCFSHLTGFQHKLFAGKSVVEFSNVLDEPAAIRRYVHWMGPALRPRMNVLDQLGYLHPPLVRSRSMAEIAASPRGQLMGQLTNFARKDDGDYAAGGWAILPEVHRVADSVLLAYEDKNGEWILFARVDVGSAMPAVSQKLDDEAYQHSGWLTSWNPEALPAETRRISAWAFDADACRAYPIG